MGEVEEVKRSRGDKRIDSPPPPKHNTFPEHYSDKPREIENEQFVEIKITTHLLQMTPVKAICVHLLGVD